MGSGDLCITPTSPPHYTHAGIAPTPYPPTPRSPVAEPVMVVATVRQGRQRQPSPHPPPPLRAPAHPLPPSASRRAAVTVACTVRPSASPHAPPPPPPRARRPWISIHVCLSYRGGGNGWGAATPYPSTPAAAERPSPTPYTALHKPPAARVPISLGRRRCPRTAVSGNAWPPTPTRRRPSARPAGLSRIVAARRPAMAELAILPGPSELPL